ncbi:alpha/beta fold hydrolase [Saccharothrix hoggarensis]|uniref:Alpha/beta fold hydrolase n=1 Tax=Saccharothrix hoggarensis TaxID=913853 RepID=A0ABW3QE12_9PSEU
MEIVSHLHSDAGRVRQPSIQSWDPPTTADSAVLVLPGGRARSREPASRANLAYRRMVPFARDTSRTAPVVWLLRYRYRGWNEPDLDPVRDARWALARLRERHPGARVALVGHSMGARTALRIADDPAVTAVCALAPWIEPGEPVDQLRGRAVLLAHGDVDRWTDPRASYRYAVRAKQVTAATCRFVVHDSGHTMLRRRADWSGLVRRFLRGAFHPTATDPLIAEAMTAPAPRGLSVALPRGTR